MNKFADETFEGVEMTLPNPAEELRQKTVQALHAETESTEPSEALGSLDKAAKKRVKRTEAEMIQALGGSALKEAGYVEERIRKLEDKISELLGSVSQKARELVLNDNPHLSRY
jgi:ribosome recycling factor